MYLLHECTEKRLRRDTAGQRREIEGLVSADFSQRMNNHCDQIVTSHVR